MSSLAALSKSTMTELPPQPSVSPAAVLEIGPILIGALLSWMLLGISVVQLYMYHVSFSQDHRFIQISAYTIFLLDVFQSIVAANEGWQVLITGWGRSVNLEYPGWTFVALPVVSSLVSFWVQTFYSWRIWQLSRSRIVPCLIVITAVVQAAAAWSISISFASLRNIASLHGTGMNIRVIIWLGVGAFTDLIIMLSMLYLLYSAKRRTQPNGRSQLIVNRLIRLTVETGFACAFSAILQLAFYLWLSETNLHLVVALILSKVYSNTLMTSLNSRALKVDSKRTELSGVQITRSSAFRSRSHTGSGTDTGSAVNPVAIHITRHITQEVEVDESSADSKGAQGWAIELDNVPVAVPLQDTDQLNQQSAIM
ncbi:hypothetical protein L226DRAFT_251716 [Lentinus tigrinus ALCF2SS1-7]|uniref:DUF6534 domain-containing protein n=1 Tax=Lentinus tigrinus ALCF2SS1-6 TaxID=1328759 RepID=A0A5C2RZT4_9APHY|nr:hypothetical protein L227DRAFT_553473 [Lentinus tigrinus ALCF2SS1-6]RPD79528.1 hypothetical protein L226DRAFT_251716 [Lentinus tigrinus ALCF2SS1-7]